MTRIREANPDDLARVVSWNLALAEESEGKALDAEVVERGVSRVLTDASLGRYFIAESDGHEAGQLMLTYEWTDWRDGVFWWIQSVYVEPAFRRRGVFKALYGHVESVARADPEVRGLRLYVHVDNTGAAGVYRKLGLAEEPYRIMEKVFRHG